MNDQKPSLRVLLDEGVPDAVAKAFKSHAHEVVPFEEAIQRGSKDALVCRAAEANDAILVAFDRDMKEAAKRLGVAGGRFKRLNLIYLQCTEPMAAKRLLVAMSFVEHEWLVSTEKVARRLHVSIGTHVLRSHR